MILAKKKKPQFMMSLKYCSMKNRINYLVVLLSFPFFSNAQFEVLNQAKCYEKYDQRRATGFMENDCEQLRGVVDCNDKLDYNKEMDLVFSQGTGKVFTGRCQTCYYSGMRDRLITFVNGKEDGADTTYYETGCIKVIREHKVGKENGIWTFYFDSTQHVAWRKGFRDGVEHGEHIIFGKTGDTVLREVYKLGLLNGPRETYYGPGLPKEIARYKEGLLDGENVSYFQNGNKSKHLRFVNGQKQGRQEYFYSSGDMMRYEIYDKNQKNGQFKSFFIGGELQAEENWVTGLRHGYFRNYHTNGRLKTENLYDRDKAIISRKYDEYGTLIEGVHAVFGEDDALPDIALTPKEKKKLEKLEKKRQKEEAKRLKKEQKKNKTVNTDTKEGDKN
jgi:antitoxin component YwqK of YwqJK toxin-antitoxin module